MPVRLNSSGGGSVTLDVPATAGTFTVNLPAANGDVVVTGGSSTVQFGAGSVSAPSITFSGDTNTGIYSPAADTIAFTEGGVEAMRLDASGNVGIGTTTPTQRLTVNTAGNYNLFFSTAADTGLSLAANNRVQGTSDFIFIQQGSGDGYLWNRANNPILFGTNNTERARITSGGDFQFNSGYGSVATAYGCRAWVNFNGTGTVAIRASANVSSIGDLGTGNYTVNFTNAMPDTNYVVVGTVGTLSRVFAQSGTLSTTVAQVQATLSNSTANEDQATMFASFFR